ncbi:MAG: hypothetical protein IJC76_02055 [Lachnospiraceae bacterium]|nr:hypothetical protein [Lachnospiraceae bacterium]
MSNLKESIKMRRNVKAIKKSGLFDRRWYMNQHLDIDFKKISPEKHYLTEGWQKSFNPSTSFSNQEYLSMYSDVEDSGMCPLLHYELFGKKEGRTYGEAQKFEISKYKRHAVRRFIGRHLGRIIYCNTIRKNKDKKILLCLHLFYMQSWKEIKEYFKNLKPYDFDLCITYPEGLYDESVMNDIKKFKPDAKIFACANKGFDVGPYLEALNSYDLTQYDIIFKLHSKGTAREKIFIYNNFFKKRDWFLYLFEGVLGSFNVHKTIKILSEKNEYGLVASSNLIVEDPPHKQNLLYKWMDELNIERPKNGYEYIAGTCFAVRAELQNNIKRLNMNLDSFADSARGTFSLAHGMERVVCLDITEQGYKFYGTKVCRLRQKIRSIGVDDYRKTSAIRMLYDDRFTLDDEFFYRGLEHRRVQSWEIVEMPLNKIRRRWFDGLIYSLTECAPYKYLQGDTKAYDEYCEYHHINNLPDMTRLRFDTLINSIKENGYNPDNIIVVSKTNILLDGQHRACCLMHLYGENYKAKVLKVSFAKDPQQLKKEKFKSIIVPKLWTAFRMFLSFGASLAIVISYTAWKSIGWAILHGLLNWIYVIYYAIKF